MELVEEYLTKAPEEYRAIYVYLVDGKEIHMCDECIEDQDLDLPISFLISSRRCEGSCDF